MAGNNHGRRASAAGLEDDEEGRLRVRMGRLDESDARIFAGMGGMAALWRWSAGGRPSALPRPRLPPRVRWDHTLIETAKHRRVRFALGSWSPGAGPEAVVKAASRLHEAAGAAKTLSYIAGPGNAGLRAHGAVYDGRGELTSTAEARDQIRQWNEQSKPAPPGAKRRRVIAWHFVWSITAPPGDEDAPRRLRTAAAKTFKDVFAAHQFPFYWRIHTDTPVRPHVHLLVKARAAGGGRIRCDRDGDFLYALRVRFADNLNICGLPAAATRREDRLHRLQDIAAGRVRLRENQAGPRAQLGETQLWRRAPRWWASHGKAALRRMQAKRTAKHSGGGVFGFRLPRIKRTHLRRRDMPEAYGLICDELNGAYRDGGKAFESVMRLAAETPGGQIAQAHRFPNAKLAAWLLERAPKWFGEPQTGEQARAHLVNAAARMRALPGGRRPERAPTHRAAHDTLHGASLGPQEAAYNRRAAARSLRRLLAWFKEKPHWPEQAAILQNRIALLERAGEAETQIRPGRPKRALTPAPATPAPAPHVPVLRTKPMPKPAPKPVSAPVLNPAAMPPAAAMLRPGPAADVNVPPSGRTVRRGQSRRRPPDLSR